MSNIYINKLHYLDKNHKYSEEVFKTVDYLQKLYQNELQLHWQRLVFVASFLILFFTGYGSYILKSFEIVKDIKNNSSNLCCLFLSLNSNNENFDTLFCKVFLNRKFNVICIFILSFSFILSYIWYLIARGSKACFEQYERALRETYKKYIKNKVYGSEYFSPEFGIKMPKSIFGAGAFSVGKLSIIIPFVFMCFALMLSIFHLIMLIISCHYLSYFLIIVTLLTIGGSVGVLGLIKSKSKSGWHTKKNNTIEE